MLSPAAFLEAKQTQLKHICAAVTAGRSSLGAAAEILGLMEKCGTLANPLKTFLSGSKKHFERYN